MSVNISTSSNNLLSPQYATFGDIITVILTTDLSVDTVTGFLNSNPLTFNLVSNSYKAEYTVNENDSNGIIDVTVTFSGITYDSGSIIEIDLEKPTATLTYSTNGEEMLKPRIGDTLSLTLTTNKELSTFPKISYGQVRTFTIDNKTITSTSNFIWHKVSTLVWTASYTLTGKELLPHNIYIDFMDKAGNIGTLYTELSFENHYYDFIWTEIAW